MTGPQTRTVASAQYQTTSAASPASRTPAVVIAVAASAVSSRRFGPADPEQEAGDRRREETHAAEPLEHRLRAFARAFRLDRRCSPEPKRDRDEEEREEQLERGEQRRVGPLARARDDDAEDDEERAGEQLADDEPGAEPERLQPACLHDRERRRERERAEPREQRVQKQLKSRVDHRDSGGVLVRRNATPATPRKEVHAHVRTRHRRTAVPPLEGNNG